MQMPESSTAKITSRSGSPAMATPNQFHIEETATSFAIVGNGSTHRRRFMFTDRDTGRTTTAPAYPTRL
jgi:hypothetical protein